MEVDNGKFLGAQKTDKEVVKLILSQFHIIISLYQLFFCLSALDPFVVDSLLVCKQYPLHIMCYLKLVDHCLFSDHLAGHDGFSIINSQLFDDEISLW